MARKIFRSGNSIVVSVPPGVLELLDLQPGDEVTVAADVERRRIVVTPAGEARARRPVTIRETLDDRIERYARALDRLTEMELRHRDAAGREADSAAAKGAEDDLDAGLLED